MKTVMNALIERVETLSDGMLNKNINPNEVIKELEEITTEASKLDKIQEIQVMASLAKLAQTLQEEREKNRKEFLEELENMNEEELEGKLKIGLIGLLKAMKANKNNTKCDSNCENCAGHFQEVVGAKVNLDNLDEDEKAEILESTKGKKVKTLNVTVNEYIDVKEVVVGEKISKVELLMILQNLRKDLKKGLMTAELTHKKGNGKDDGTVLMMRYSFGKHIVIDLSKTKMNVNEVDEFCDSFIHKYLV